MRQTFARRVVAALAMAGAAFASSIPAAQAGNRDFTLANRLPWTTVTVEVRPAGSQGWSRDLLGSAVLPSGRQMLLRLGEGGQCVFDVRLGYGDQVVTVFNGINLCRLDTMSVYWQDGAKAELRLAF